MAEIPSAKEFAAVYRRMDLPTRSRLERHARRGELAANPEEAALVAAFAERALRQLRWNLVLVGILLALSVLSAVVVESAVRWLYLAAALLAAIAFPVFLSGTGPAYFGLSFATDNWRVRGSRSE